MQLVLYEGNQIYTVYLIPNEGVEVDMKTRSVSWTGGGGIGGINVDFVIVPDGVDTSAITPELIEADIKDTLKPWKLVTDESLAECRERLDLIEAKLSSFEASLASNIEKLYEIEQRICALEQSAAPPEGTE